MNPFTIKITYNETLENLIIMISLTVTTVPISEFQLRHNGIVLKKRSMRLDQIGIRHGDTVELEQKISRCCRVF
jgi:hypothetical protein